MKIAIAITGASGSVYAKVFLDLLQQYASNFQAIDVVMSNNAKDVWKHELQNENYTNYHFRFFDKHDFNAPFASGSAGYHALVVVPCSMGTLSRIACGISDDLITRAADVQLKERRKLILVTRETPLNLIQIKNMAAVTEAGGIICPATPSFYSLPKTIEEMAYTVVHRVVDLIGLKVDSYRWGKS
jgi:4-hydroxy-3-polyprenylbenzoate decarboxylase